METYLIVLIVAVLAVAGYLVWHQSRSQPGAMLGGNTDSWMYRYNALLVQAQLARPDMIPKIELAEPAFQKADATGLTSDIDFVCSLVHSWKWPWASNWMRRMCSIGPQ